MLRTASTTEQEMTYSVPPVTPRAETKTERRYDPQTVEKAVALAAKMQAEHQETLSSEELENIAAEAGIRPEFMRHALSLLDKSEQEVQTTPVIVKRRARTSQRAGLRRLTRRQKRLIFGYPALYAALAFIPLTIASNWTRYGPDSVGFALLLLLIVLIPSAFAIMQGANLGRKRQGAVAGAMTGAMTFFATLLAVMIGSSNGANSGEMVVALPIMTLIGAFLGFTSAWLKQTMPLWLGATPADPAEEELGD